MSKNAKSILLCDDEVDFLTLLESEINEALAGKMEVEIYLCSNGLQALNYSMERKFDLIITDHLMPKMTGVELLKCCHTFSYSLNKRTPFIIVSGHIPMVKEILDMAENTILVDKPFKTESLIRNIKMLLNHPQPTKKAS